MNEQSENKASACHFCNDKKGIMVKIEEEPLKGSWVHIVCVNWNNECSFKHKTDESGTIEILPILDQLPKQESYGRQCYICISKDGLTIKCDYGNCNNSFHVRCAISSRLIQTRQNMND